MATVEQNHEVTDTETLKPSDEKPVSSVAADTQPFESEHADTESEHDVTKGLSEDVAGSEHAEALPVSNEVLGSEKEPVKQAETVSSEQVSAEGEAMNVDIPDQQVSASELAYSHSDETLKPSDEQPISSVAADTKPLDSEHADTVSQPTGEEALGSEHVVTKGSSEEVLESEHAEARPVSNEVLGSEQESVKQAEIVSSEQVSADGKPMHVDIPAEQVSAPELAYSHSDETLKPSDEQPVSSVAADTQPFDSEHTDNESHPTGEEALGSEHDGTNGLREEVLGSEHAEARPVSNEVLGSEQESVKQAEIVSSEQVSAEGKPKSVDIPDQQLSASELAYSHSDDHMQQVHAEYVNSQSYDHESHPAMYEMETLHENSEFVKAEHIHPEPMHEDAMNADLEDQLQMSSELMHELQVTSELSHQVQVTSDFVPLQSIDSEIVHSQPMNSDLVHSEPYGTEFDNMQIVATEMVNSEFPDPETQPSKRRKKKSVVWEHFTIEAVGAGCRRACCKVCKQSFAYSTGSKVAGTSHLKRHIAKGSCPLLLRQQDKNQVTPYAPKSAGNETATPATTETPKRRYRTSNAPYLIFDQDRCRHEIARMIIMHEYPLQMVEHSGFVSFVQNLQPRFDMVNFSTVQGDCVATYLREKQNLQKFIDGMPGRICLSLDMWTSCQTTGYVFLHCQFIDQEFKLHRRLLNVVMEPFPESDNAFSHAVGTCLSYWNLDNKLCSITFNHSLSDAARENMRGLLSVKNSSVLNGQLLLGSCLARTLSGMAQDVLAAGQDAVRKIRSSVKYVKTSDAHEDKFLELKQQLQVPSDKSLMLDNVTRWNTTYDMLVAACELKEVFSCVDTSDPEYKDAPSTEDWNQADSIRMYLKILIETASFLVEKSPPSTNVFFHEVWKIQLELTRNASSEDPFVRNVAGVLQEKFLNYWRGSFLVLAIAVAMDPRFKMKLVEFSFAKLFGEEAPAYIRMADEGIHGLFHEYMALSGEVNGVIVEADGNQSLVTSSGLTDFDMYIMETTSQQMKSELDEYLDESLLPRMQELDVIGWWKLNRIKYPTLSKMARDILSIPLSSVGPSYVFDTVSRDMDQQWSCLRPETMEALMCAKDWLSSA